MLTQHIYWYVSCVCNSGYATDPFLWLRNLDAFQGSENILNHHLHVDASRVVEVDGDAIPTGNFINVTGTPWDFTTPQKINYRWNETVGLCGGGSCFHNDVF